MTKNADNSISFDVFKDAGKISKEELKTLEKLAKMKSLHGKVAEDLSKPENFCKIQEEVEKYKEKHTTEGKESKGVRYVNYLFSRIKSNLEGYKNKSKDGGEEKKDKTPDQKNESQANPQEGETPKDKPKPQEPVENPQNQEPADKDKISKKEPASKETDDKNESPESQPDKNQVEKAMRKVSIKFSDLFPKNKEGKIAVSMEDYKTLMKIYGSTIGGDLKGDKMIIEDKEFKCGKLEVDGEKINFSLVPANPNGAKQFDVPFSVELKDIMKDGKIYKSMLINALKKYIEGLDKK